ncbi:hypothetical protein MHI39_07220 [Heyndrickxia sp. FSL K6-6286]|uniref:hypothetical protein n=1 Tax=Heyndrickxia sp. FSL K6-6286 TaxID=2921510 RepID=UPI00315AEC2A
MNKRDRAIIDDLERFRCMSRDDIADIHFRNVSNSITAANRTLLRLYRLGKIDRSTEFQPFVYFPADNSIRKDSQKIPHFLELVRVYRDMLAFAKPTRFNVEVKYSKGLAEPDIFAIWKGSPLFIEVQRSAYSDRQINDKITRYEALYQSGVVYDEPWQPSARKVFPTLLILTKTRYAVKSDNFAIMQAESIADFVRMVEPKEKPVPIKQTGGIRLKIG